MGFFNDFLEGKVIKALSSKTVDDLLSLSREDRAVALFSAAHFAVNMLGNEQNQSDDEKIICSVMVDPSSVSSNDCMVIFDMLSKNYSQVENASRKQKKELEITCSNQNLLSFITKSIDYKIISMQIVLFLLADRSGKIPSPLCHRFYASMNESSTGAMFEVEEEFIKINNVSSEFNPEAKIIDHIDTGTYMNIVKRWNVTGMLRHSAS